MCRVKARGPDGFTLAFLQQYWNIVKSELLQTIAEFQETTTFKKSLNASFVSIVPKKEGMTSIKDSRPIGLVGNIYKIISTVLSNRLKKVWMGWCPLLKMLLCKENRYWMQL